MSSFKERQLKRGNTVIQQVENTAADRVEDNSVKLEIVPCEMDALIKSKMVTSDELGSMVNEIFLPVLMDYAGSRVIIRGTKIELELFFEEQQNQAEEKDGKFYAIQRKDATNNKSGAMAIIDRYNNRNKVATIYELTEKAKKALTPFVSPENFADYRAKKVNWSRVVSEVQEKNNWGIGRVYLKVTLDVERVIAARYGAKIGDVDYSYLISLVRPLVSFQDPANNGNIIVTKWLISIQQLETNTLKEIMNKAGFGFKTVNDLGIIRAR